jgi:hypothetical protein
LNSSEGAKHVLIAFEIAAGHNVQKYIGGIFFLEGGIKALFRLAA